MKVGNTQHIYQRRRNTKDYLNNMSIMDKLDVAPVPLCIVINQIPIDTETPFTFRTKTYKKYFYDVETRTLQQEMELLIARFKFVSNAIRHNLKLTRNNGADFLQEDIKAQVHRPILLHELRVSSQIVHLNGYCDLKNLLIKVIDPNSNEKVNNINSLTLIFNKIKSHRLCTNEIVETLTSIYNSCIELSTQIAEAIKNDTISLNSLMDACISADINYEK